MHFTEIAKHKRHCGTCKGEIKKGEAHLVYGYDDKRTLAVKGKNLCRLCTALLLLETINLEESHKGEGGA